MIEDDAAVEPGSRGRPGPRGLPPVTFRWWEALLAYLFGNLVIGALVVSIFGATAEGASSDRQILATFALDLAFVGSLAVWLRNAHPGSWPAIGFAWWGRAVAAGAVAGLALYGVAAAAIGTILRWLFERAAGHEVHAPEQMPDGLSTGGTVLFVVLAVAIAPVVEEVFFRGILYRSLRDRHGVGVGLIGSALFFGAVHYLPGPMASALLLQTVMVLTGLGLALIYERAGTLVASIAAHAAFNVVGVILILDARG